MPELDFLIIADYVRAEGGVLHMIAAGFDTIFTPTVPAARQVGVGMRIRMTPAEARHEQDVELIYQDADGRRISQVNAKLTPQVAPQALPAGASPGVALAFNMMLPLPAYGRYSLELIIGSASMKSIPITISPPPRPVAGSLGHG